MLAQAVVVAAIASGTGAETQPKPVRAFSVAPSLAATPIKAVSLVVLSDDRAKTAHAARVAQAELTKACLRASNDAVAELLRDAGQTMAATTDPLADIGAAANMIGVNTSSRVLLLVAPAVAVTLGTTAATGGGQAYPDLVATGAGSLAGVPVFTADALTDSPGDAILVDAARVAVAAESLRLSTARHANLQMDDAPSGAAAAFSLWQRNCTAIKCERLFSLAMAADTSAPSVRITGAW